LVRHIAVALEGVEMAKPSRRVRCVACGKWFKAAKATEIRCPDCTRAVQKQRAAQDATPRAASARPTFVIERLTPEELAAQREHERAAAQARREARRERTSVVGAEQPQQAAIPPLPGKDAAGTVTGRPLPHARGERPRRPGAAKATPPEPAAPEPKAIPRKERRPSTPRFVLTPEQVAAIERRYRELAQPHEYDGTRHTIAAEMGIPLRAVREVVQKLRQRERLTISRPPADLGITADELARVRECYLPLLPLPPVGIHKQIAAELGMANTRVFQAIALIRQELGLPQYNPRADGSTSPSGEQPQAPGAHITSA